MNEERERKSELNPELKSGADIVLQGIVAATNQVDAEIGITLNVSGLVISGQLISSKTYFGELSKLMGLAETNSEGGSAVASAFNKFFQTLADSPNSSNETQIPEYIHLKNARSYISGDSVIPNSGALWRGQLSSVDGFFIGELSVKKRREMKKE